MDLVIAETVTIFFYLVLATESVVKWSTHSPQVG